MKLLYITNGTNGSGGLERVLSIKASALAEEWGYEVAILVLNETHKNNFYNFSSKIAFYSINVNGHPIRYFKQYKTGVQKVINDFEPDIISVCDDGLKGFLLPSIIKTPAKWIYERHVSKLIEKKNNQGHFKQFITLMKWKIMEFQAQKFSKFIVLTEGNKKEWASLKNIKVISNPLSFYPEKSASLENKIIISVGKISYQKGQDLLMKAWERVHENYPEWELHLYGKENLGYLNTHHLKNNVHFFSPVKDIASKYLESSIYVMSSRFEGFGMVLIEAMACGVPCVSFNCDYGPGDIIQHGEDGYLVPKNDIHQLSEKLLILIKDQEKRKIFGKKAKQNVKHYLPEEIIKQWDELFKSL